MQGEVGRGKAPAGIQGDTRVQGVRIGPTGPTGNTGIQGVQEGVGIVVYKV